MITPVGINYKIDQIVPKIQFACGLLDINSKEKQIITESGKPCDMIFITDWYLEKISIIFHWNPRTGNKPLMV